MKEELVELGYERTGQVELPGQFSVRGGIIDIYPLTEDNPWRIELWDDEVDSIRSFDAESQRSLENVDEITIYPAAEKMDGEDMVSFLDYFPEEKTLVFLDELNHLAENGEGVEEEYRQSRMHREEKGEANLPEQWLCGFQELQKKLNRRNCVAVSAQMCIRDRNDPSCGDVFRVKGFLRKEDGQWLELNATRHEICIRPAKLGQEIMIVIGEKLNKEVIDGYWK